jgi:uncharacterized protein
MRDGLALRMLKALVRSAWTVEYAIRRLRPSPWTLAGTCGSCAACCERPSIRGGLISWYVPVARKLFLGWQRRVNGFALVDADDETQTWHFRCTHFDWATRRCDSYASRPFLCRDYPRGLMDQAWPDLFDSCGHRAIAPNAAGLLGEVDKLDLPPEAKEKLRRGLRIE